MVDGRSRCIGLRGEKRLHHHAYRMLHYWSVKGNGASALKFYLLGFLKLTLGVFVLLLKVTPETENVGRGSQFCCVFAIPLRVSRTQAGSIEFGFTGPRRSSCVLHVKCRESLLTSAVFTFARVKSESFIFICPFLWHAVLRYSVYDSSSPLNHFAGLWHSLTYCPALQRRLCRLGGLAFRLGYVILFSLEFVSLLVCLMLNV